MKVGVLSDIHGNHVALEECIKDGENNGVDDWIVLGDIVDRCPGINETFALLEKIKPTYLKGNHEESFWKRHQNRNPLLLPYQHRVIEPEYLAIVKQLALSSTYVIDEKTSPIPGVIFTHSNFQDSADWGEYIYSKPHIRFETESYSKHGLAIQLGIVGHTHVPIIGQIHDETKEINYFAECNSSQTVSYADAKTEVVAPSVGIPRDSSSSTGYVIVDSNNQEVTVRRIPYSIKELFAHASTLEDYDVSLLYNLDLFRI